MDPPIDQFSDVRVLDIENRSRSSRVSMLQHLLSENQINANLNVHIPLDTLASALLESIKFSLELQLSEVVFEGDCLSIVQALSEESFIPPWQVRKTLADCRAMCSNLPWSSSVYTPRSANKVAHKIARRALVIPSMYTWSSIPSILDDCIADDIMLSS
uniref:RNase H type-1 domain-containing protein n=1 Tax=Nelumbo nucifera TaxID=4432 RepID=A0A822XXH6_NELNU|nr:TPA_asm: hypothetical protein HUJ06_026504 [Nelumbo nucifera]